jgi:hypothetical protein
VLVLITGQAGDSPALPLLLAQLRIIIHTNLRFGDPLGDAERPGEV